MNRHRILHVRDPPGRPMRPSQALSLAFFLGLFALFASLVLLSRLGPSPMTGRAANASMGTTVNVSPFMSFACDYNFSAGTNLVSLPCLPAELDRTAFLENFSSQGASVEAIYKYSPTTNGRWQVYSPSLPNYTIQSLSKVSRSNGLYFVMAAPDRFRYWGPLPKNSSILLRQGWNLVGYPSARVEPLSTTLLTINDTYAAVKTLEGTEESGVYLVDTPPPGGETLISMGPYYGYWILVNASDTWVLIT